MKLHPVQILLSLAGLAALTYVAYGIFHVNATTAGFAYLLLVLVVASTWGFIEASILSVAATLAFNFFFLPPVGTIDYCRLAELGCFVYVSYNISYCQPIINKGETAGFGCS